MAELGSNSTDRVPSADPEARNIGFSEVVRLETEQKTGIMASRPVVMVMALENRLDATQIAEICEKMSETHLRAGHMVREWNWGVKRNHGTMDVADGRMFKNVLTMY